MCAARRWPRSPSWSARAPASRRSTSPCSTCCLRSGCRSCGEAFGYHRDTVGDAPADYGDFLRTKLYQRAPSRPRTTCAGLALLAREVATVMERVDAGLPRPGGPGPPVRGGPPRTWSPATSRYTAPWNSRVSRPSRCRPGCSGDGLRSRSRSSGGRSTRRQCCASRVLRARHLLAHPPPRPNQLGR